MGARFVGPPRANLVPLSISCPDENIPHPRQLGPGVSSDEHICRFDGVSRPATETSASLPLWDLPSMRFSEAYLWSKDWTITHSEIISRRISVIGIAC